MALMVEKLLDMKSQGYYYKGGPIYGFHTSYPTNGVRLLDQGYDTYEAAALSGRDYIDKYQARAPWSNMGEFLGVTLKNNKYFAVVIRRQ